MVIAQRLTRSIIIEQATESKSSNGAVTKTWATYYTTKAKVNQALGTEYFQSKQIASSQSVKFNLRYDSKAAAITPKMRINYGGNYYDIESVINAQDTNREIVLMAVLTNAR